MQYTTERIWPTITIKLFYQDFKDTFVCNTQLYQRGKLFHESCFIRISKILLYAIHNSVSSEICTGLLFYQDFKDTFVCNTQPPV